MGKTINWLRGKTPKAMSFSMALVLVFSLLTSLGVSNLFAARTSANVADHVLIYAYGNTGTEIMRLKINGQYVKSWTNVDKNGYQNYIYVPDADIVVNDIRVHMTNGGVHAGEVRQLYVNYINIVSDTVNGTADSEDPTTLARGSTGSYIGSPCEPEGYVENEVLQCGNAFFDYDVPVFTLRHGNDPVPDQDGDGIGDDVDNCINTPNADQLDADGDDVGAACDFDSIGSSDDNPCEPNASHSACLSTLDTDNDGFADDVDLCPFTGSFDPRVSLVDGCAYDYDYDLYYADADPLDTARFDPDDNDECVPNDTGFGCPGFMDADNDGLSDTTDNCVNTPNPDQADLDGDGEGDVCDATPNGDDQDNDGFTTHGPLPDPYDLDPCVPDNSGPSCNIPGVGTVTIRARGETGAEKMVLEFGSTSVQTWDDVAAGGYNDYTYTTSSATPISRLRVKFTNAGQYQGSTKNLHIDYINVNGVIYQSEDIETLARGSISSLGDSCQTQGFRENEILKCTGWFEYDLPAGYVLEPGTPDTDGDNVTDDIDNCIHIPNPFQTESDGDNEGDSCDATPYGDSYAEYGLRCQNLTITLTNDPRVVMVDMDMFESDPTTFVQVNGTKHTGATVTSLNMTRVNSGNTFPAEYNTSQDFDASMYSMSASLSTSPAVPAQNVCRAAVEVVDTQQLLPPQISCSMNNFQQSQNDPQVNHLIAFRRINTAISEVPLNYGDNSYGIISAPTDITVFEESHSYPVRAGVSYYSPRFLLDEKKLTDSGQNVPQFACGGAPTLTFDSDDQDQSWNPPSGVTLIDPRPYVAQLQPGTSASSMIATVNSFFQETYNQFPVPASVQQPAPTQVTISSALQNTVLIDPNNAEQVEKLRITLHGVLDHWSRTPLSISSKNRIDYILITHDDSTFADSDGYGMVIGTKLMQFANNTAGVLSSQYQTNLYTLAHEYGHNFHYNHLYQRLGVAGYIPVTYQPFENEHPNWFVDYGGPETLDLENRDPIGNLYGFLSNYSAFRLNEQLAEHYAHFFQKGEWQEVENRLALNPDSNRDAKIQDFISQIQGIDPNLDLATLKALSEMPSYLPVIQ